MAEEKKVVRIVAYYHLCFYDPSWVEIPSLGRQFSTAHDMMVHVEQWNHAHQRACRLGSSGVSNLSAGQFLSLEVHYGEA